MTKTGRNEPCPCGSGIKYKRCCLNRKQDDVEAVSPVQQLKISLMAEIEKITKAAHRNEEIVRELGVFIFCTTSDGDAWLLEITESDAVHLVDAGKPLDIPVDENPETIEIHWSHTFAIRDRKFYLTSYADKAETCPGNMPTKRIHAAIRRIRKKYSAEQLNQVHISQPASE